MSDAVLHWNSVALQVVANDHTPDIVKRPDQGGPTRTSRALAIAHAAIFDAVNSIDGSFTPYLTSIPEVSTASVEAAVAQAAFETLAHLYPSQKKAFLQKALTEALEAIPDGKPKEQGRQVGAEVASQIIAARRNDNSNLDQNYVPGSLPGQHREDPLNPGQGFLTPRWGVVTPFTLNRNGGQGTPAFRSSPPPTLISDDYTDAFNEVKTKGGDGNQTPTDRTDEQTVIGIFWAYDGTPRLGTPPRLYNQIARQIAKEQGNTLVENARLFALVNLAMADAGIQCWDTKYFYNLWRPILGVREADPGTGPSDQGDGNPATNGDPNWTPLGAPNTNNPGKGNFTPNFPAYTSGHATFGAALFQILKRFYDTDTIPFTFVSDEFNGQNLDVDGTVRPLLPRSYNSFSQASDENGQSRIYLGIHWQFDKVQGIRAGEAIADFVFDNFLRPTKNSIDICSVPNKPILQVGSTGPVVRALKDLLLNSEIADAGVSGFNIDDIFNAKTEAVVKNFQCQVFLTADGIVEAKTWKSLCADNPVDLPILRRGSIGELVAQVQRRLDVNGYALGATDGNFGAKTEAAVKAFQNDKNLFVDGIIGPQTWNALSRLRGVC